MFGFMAERFDKHGPAFRSHILGDPTVFIHGADLTDVWLDDTWIQREGSFPKNIQALFGGRSLPLLDGPTHETRKRIVLAAFKRDAFASYVPKLEAAIEESFARVATGAEVKWLAPSPPSPPAASTSHAERSVLGLARAIAQHQNMNVN
jgi:cytochrome P450